jgi:dynein heavy chain 2
MRTVQHQLLHLLSEQEVADLKVNEVFRPFEPLSPLHHSPYAKPAWDAATSEYMKAMQPVEREVARKLHKRLTSSGLKGHALLRDCLRHKELVLRPMVFAELAPAREALLGQMEGQLEVLREDFETRTGQGMANGAAKTAPVGKNMPEVVSQVVLARQLQDRVGEMLAAGETLLHDLQGMGRFQAKAQELHVYLNDYAQHQFGEWVELVETELRDDTSGLAMQLTGKLLEVSKEDHSLVVNYSDRLVRFLREVRQLSAMGFKMPQAVQWNADVAHRFYRHGVVLKQVAHFYNTIDTQIVRSQKPLLLDFALHFEHLATNPNAQATADKGKSGKVITWSDPNQLEEYISKLHEASGAGGAWPPPWALHLGWALGPLKARGSPERHPGSLQWPSQLASGRPKG